MRRCKTGIDRTEFTGAISVPVTGPRERQSCGKTGIYLHHQRDHTRQTTCLRTPRCTPSGATLNTADPAVPVPLTRNGSSARRMDSPAAIPTSTLCQTCVNSSIVRQGCPKYPKTGSDVLQRSDLVRGLFDALLAALASTQIAAETLSASLP